MLLLSRSPRALFRGHLRGPRQDRPRRRSAIFGVLVVLAGLVSRGVTRPIEALSARLARGRGRRRRRARRRRDRRRSRSAPSTRTSAPWPRRSSAARATCATSPPPSATSSRPRWPASAARSSCCRTTYETMTPAERRRFLDNIAADADRLSAAGHPPAGPGPRRHGARPRRALAPTSRAGAAARPTRARDGFAGRRRPRRPICRRSPCPSDDAGDGADHPAARTAARPARAHVTVAAAARRRPGRS